MDKFTILLFVCTLTFNITFGGSRQKGNIKIGTLHDANNWQVDLAFKYAIHRINMDSSILPVNTLVPIKEKVGLFDSYSAGKKACNLTEQGIGAIFGPQTAHNSEIVTSIGENLEIPTILTSWDFTNNEDKKNCTINVFPETNLLSKAFADLLSNMNWKGFTVLYDEEMSLIYLKEILKYHDAKDAAIIFHQLELDSDYRPLLKDIQLSGEAHVIVHIPPDRLLEFFRQAREVKMMEEYQSYFLTHLDSHIVDLEEFKLGRTNITSVRLFDPGNDDMKYIVKDWIEGEKRENNYVELSEYTVSTDAVLIYDSIYVYAQSIHNHGVSRHPPLSCNKMTKSPNGYATANYMKLFSQEGLTGVIGFDSFGRRTNFKLYVIELARDGYMTVGYWTPSEGVSYSDEFAELQTTKLKDFFHNKTFIVASKIGAPYLSWKDPSNTSLTGNDRFEGHSFDLIAEIARELNFKFVFELVPDNNYGSYNPRTKKWNGLVKQLLDRKADLAVCDLTITYDRERAVDFTMPFMTLGISILFSKPKSQDPSLWTFLDPFSFEVWMYMATAYLGVSLLLFVLARMSPYEWDNPHPCNQDNEELENTFNLVNCLWFSLGSLMGQGCDLLPKISPYEWEKPHPCNNEPDEMETNMNLSNSIWHNCGSLMQQGSDIAPKAVSSRLLAGMWWFFTLIMISSYTASLAAFLTLDQMKIEIKSAEDLAKQSSIRYGAVKGGSTLEFFMGHLNAAGIGGVSTRMVAGMWWFFTLIMISSYTANLAAFLTSNLMGSTINSAEDLSIQNRVKYGAVAGGSTASFFQKSNFSTYQRMWAAMESARPSVFTQVNEEGVERVQRGKREYAFIMESTGIEYQVERKCDLQQIGGLLDSKGYGIAMPMNSPYRTDISGVVLKMQEDGRLFKLKEKWWKEMHDGGRCKDDEGSGEDASAAELGLANVGGVFVVLVLGCLAGFFMAIMEFLWNIRKIAVEEGISPKEALIMELKFAIQCGVSTKPVRKRKEGSTNSSNTSNGSKSPKSEG